MPRTRTVPSLLAPLVLLVAVAALLVAPAGPARADAAVVNTTAPTLTGTARLGEPVSVDPGTWEPDGVTFSYRWLRDGTPLTGATGATYRPVLADLGTALSVEVTGSLEGETPLTVASQPVTVRRGLLTNTERPRIRGARRFDHVLTATPGAWSRVPQKVRYQWFRGDREIKGATGRRHRLGLADFGRRISVEVRVQREGFRWARATSGRTGRIGHRVPVRRVVTYHIETRGSIRADVGVFARQAQQTYADPRGWRGAGVAFRRVAKGGSFTLVLSEASRVPGFSSGCSSEWSCRVGRYVVINQTRWLHASPMWNARGRSVRDYRHMVVNHETGHWLGRGHRTCPRPGALAPVMQQQSKGLQGCRPNPWPTASER